MKHEWIKAVDHLWCYWTPAIVEGNVTGHTTNIPNEHWTATVEITDKAKDRHVLAFHNESELEEVKELLEMEAGLFSESPKSLVWVWCTQMHIHPKRPPTAEEKGDNWNEYRAMDWDERYKFAYKVYQQNPIPYVLGRSIYFK